MSKAVLGMVLGFFSAATLLPAAHGASSVEAAYQALDLFGDVYARVRTNYKDQVDDAQLVDFAIEGFVSSLDPHSSYLSASELAARNRATASIGLEIASEYTLAKVVGVIAGAPASRAGIKPDDYIVAIDGGSIQGLSSVRTAEMLRGPENSSIALTILRRGEQKPLEFTVARALIQVQSVEYEGKDRVGYIRIASFTSNTGSLVERAVADLKRSIGPDIEGYVLDLRNNPGGLLEQVLAVADLFLSDGVIATTGGRRDNRTYNARRGDVADGKPMMVLINGRTAAGAEVLAGTLQDHRRATVLGARSLGRGSIQTIIPVGGSGRQRGELRLTTGEFRLPSGRAIEPSSSYNYK